MEAIKFKTLSEESEIDMYLSKFEGFVGVRLPYDYSMRSTIVGAFKGEEMIGGIHARDQAAVSQSDVCAGSSEAGWKIFQERSILNDGSQWRVDQCCRQVSE